MAKKGKTKRPAVRKTKRPAVRKPKSPTEAEPDGTFGELDEAFVKEWTAKRTTPVPERVYDLKESLGIDEKLKSRIKPPRGPRIRSHLVDRVVLIGRHMLAVAISEAVSQKELHPRQSEWEPWSRIAKALQDAGAALDGLFDAIDPSGKEAEHFARFIRQSRADRIEASKAGYRDADESALRDARVLVEAKQIIDNLRVDTLTRRDKLVAIYPGSSQDHQKRAFVKILAEGWIFLTGEMPGKHRDPLKNPFLRVVEAAWTDWGKVKNSDALAFGEALKAAISSIDKTQLNRLVAAGPEWLVLKGMI